MTKKTIIITGAMGLLGKSACKFFNSNNFHVIGIDIVDQPSDLTDGVDYIKFDLMDINSYSILADRIKELTKNLACLINNAAYNPKIEGGQFEFSRFESLNLEDWNKEMMLNLTSPVFLTQALLPLFNRDLNDYCKIINVISTYGLVPPNQSIYKNLSEASGIDVVKPIAYPVSKAGLAMVTKYLSTYLGEVGFNVNGIAPGGIENGQDPIFVNDYSSLVPMKRMAKVEEMLETLYLLASKGSNYINGQIIAVDGGWTTW